MKITEQQDVIVEKKLKRKSQKCSSVDPKVVQYWVKKYKKDIASKMLNMK